MTPIGCKWMFTIKRNPSGSIYKAKLVAKGFRQKERLDYDQVFSPVVKPSIVRVMLSIALSKDLSIRQFDFNNSFLNWDLQEDVYRCSLRVLSPRIQIWCASCKELCMVLNKHLKRDSLNSVLH